jgi:polyphosphate kinase
MVKKNLPASHFLNRELGLLEFNRRVLAQAADDSVPLLERLRF